MIFSKRHIVSLLWVILLLSGGGHIYAQQSNTLYLMHSVPQANLLNPAVQISCKYYVGIPVLSSIYSNLSNTAFTYNNFAATDTWNIEGVTDQMHRRDLYTAEAQLNLLAFGYRHKSLYFTFKLSEKVQGYQTIPGEMAEMAVYGNGPAVGETGKFDAFRPGGYHTRTYSLGVSKVLGPYLTAGIRANLIFGKANLTSGPNKVRLNTRENDFAINILGNYTINSSFPMTIIQDDEGNITGVDIHEIDPMSYMMNRGNVGFGLDFGLIYEYTEKLTLSASVIDLALVRWKTDLNNVKSEGEFLWEGGEINMEIFSEDFLYEFLDSIQSTLETTTTMNPYTYFMPAQVFLAGSYQYSEKVSFGLVNRNVIYRSKLHSSFTLSAQTELAGKFTGTASWSYLNNSLLNLGMGIAWHGKGIQFHAVTDNLLWVFFPFDTRTLNLRLGFNLLLGCPRNKKENLQEQSYGFLPKGGDCPYPESREKSRRKQKKVVRRINKI